MGMRVTLTVDLKTDDPNEAYEAIQEIMAHGVEDLDERGGRVAEAVYAGWETTDLWYAASGTPIELDDIERARSRFWDEQDKDRLLSEIALLQPTLEGVEFQNGVVRLLIPGPEGVTSVRTREYYAEGSPTREWFDAAQDFYENRDVGWLLTGERSFAAPESDESSESARQESNLPERVGSPVAHLEHERGDEEGSYIAVVYEERATTFKLRARGSLHAARLAARLDESYAADKIRVKINDVQVLDTNPRRGGDRPLGFVEKDLKLGEAL